MEELNIEMELVSVFSFLSSTCMKCQNESDILLCSTSPGGIKGLCSHRFCQSCFRIENMDLASSPPHTFKCPCCHAGFYGSIQSIDEAILLGEANTLRTNLSLRLRRARRAHGRRYKKY